MAGTPSVLVVGESLTDIVVSADGETRHPGGSPMNVAVGLSRLGIATRLLTRIGRDPDGDDIRAHLENAGVALLPESVGDLPSSSARATIAADGAAVYEFDIDWRLDGPQELPPADWVHIGSVSTFLSPGADTIERLLTSLGTATVVSYDPNIRAALVGDPDEARARFERICRLADVVKLSDEDAAWLYPGREDLIEWILTLGPRVVAMTRGAGGAVIATLNSTANVPAVPVRVADTIGAGDSFMAALIQQLLSRDLLSLTEVDLTQAGACAARAAAITCGRAGADPPFLSELE